MNTHITRLNAVISKLLLPLLACPLFASERALKLVFQPPFTLSDALVAADPSLSIGGQWLPVWEQDANISQLTGMELAELLEELSTSTDYITMGPYRIKAKMSAIESISLHDPQPFIAQEFCLILIPRKKEEIKLIICYFRQVSSTQTPLVGHTVLRYSLDSKTTSPYHSDELERVTIESD